MAKNNLADLSVTAASNTDILGQSVAGTAVAATLDTIVQNTLGVLARFYDDIGATGTVGGTADAITLTTSSVFQSLANGNVVAFKAGSTNTTAVTINVDALGAKAIRNQGDSALAAGALVANGIYWLRYDTAYNAAAGAWVLLNVGGYLQGGVDVAVTDGGTGSSTASGALFNLGLPASIPGYLWGLTLSNNASDATNDIDIAVGVAMDGGNVDLMSLTSLRTKRLDAAWVVGTDQGGLDTGSIADTTYHVWLIKRSDTGVVDVLFSASVTAPTMPANYTYKRRIGSIIRASSAIVGFVQAGDRFDRKVPISDVSTSAPGTTAVTRTLSVPLGISVEAMLAITLQDDSGTASSHSMLVTSLDQTDTASTGSVHDVAVGGSASADDASSTSKRVRTNSSGQIRSRNSYSDASVTIRLVTHGWIDGRGRAA